MDDNPVITASFNRKSLDDWTAGVSRNFRKELGIANQAIRREWIYEFDRQSRDNVSEGWWRELDPKYETRKNKKHPQNAGYVLKASGDMFHAYLRGIQEHVDTSTIGVTINLPDDETRLRAEVHEGLRASPKGVEPRPFNKDPFIEIAWVEFNRAMKRATE